MGLTRSSLSSCLAVREHAPLLLTALLAVLLAGCGEENPESLHSPSPLPLASEFIQLELQAQLPQSPFASEVTSVHVQIVGPAQAGITVSLTQQGDTWKGSVLVPKTEEGYFFVGRALNDARQFLFESIIDVPAAGPNGSLSVVLPFTLRLPLAFTQLEFQAQLPQSPLASEVSSVHVQIVGPLQASTTVPLSRQGNTWKGSVRLPAVEGGYYVVGRALSADSVFLFESVLGPLSTGPDGTLKVVLPFTPRTP
jgi:hypothetical protein